MSKLRSLWRKAKGYLYSGSGMAMLVVAEFAHGEGVGAIGRRAATEADGLVWVPKHYLPLLVW